MNIDLQSTDDRRTATLRMRPMFGALLGLFIGLPILTGLAAQVADKRIDLTAEEQAWIKAHPVARTLSLDNWPPFDFVTEAGEPTGIAIDIFRVAANRIGLRLEWQQLPWSEGLAAAKEKRLDLIPDLVNTVERREFLTFTEPFMTVPHYLVFKEKSPLRSIKDLAGRRLALEKDFYTVKWVKENYPQVEVVEVGTSLDAIVAVSLGQADAYLGTVSLIAYTIEQNQIAGLQSLPCPEHPAMQLSMAVRNDWALLIPILEKGLASVTAKERRAIRQRYVSMQVEQSRELFLTEVEKAWLKKHPNLRLGVSSDWPPFEYVDAAGQHAGISSEYIRWLNEKLGITLHPQPDMTWTQILNAARNREIDVISSIMRSEEREEYLTFTKPFLNTPLMIITRKDTGYVENLEALKGQTVSVVDGYLTQSYLERDHPQLNLLAVENAQAALAAVVDGRAVATVENVAVFTMLTAQSGMDSLKVAAPTPYSLELALGVRSDMPELAAILDKALDAIPNQDRAVFQDRWVSSRVESHVDWMSVVLISLGVTMTAALVVGFILRSNQRLTAEVEERRRAERELALAKEQADAASQAKSAFLATMSHEIRTPMNAIINMTELALGTDLNRKQNQYLSVVSRSANGLLALINDILDFSKVEAGKLELEEAPFSIRELMDELTDSFRGRVLEKGIEFVVHVAPDVTDVVLGDSLRLRQVLINLTGNAFKFTDQGEVVVHVTQAGIRPSNGDAPGAVRLKFSVRDSGIGIPKAAQEKLFQSFSQVDSSTTRKYGGTGLGLAISQKLVDLMEGELAVNSVEGDGAEFFFTGRFSYRESQQPEAKAPSESLNNLRALVMEDSRSNAELMETLLGQFGLTTHVYTTTDYGLEKLRQANLADSPAKFDIVFANSLLTVREMRKSPALATLPIVLMGASGNRTEEDRAKALGIRAFVSKPIIASHLYDAIARIFDDTHSTQMFGRKKGSTEGDEDYEKILKGIHVLMAEDNEANQFVAQELLASAGIVLDIADDGRIAVDRLAGEKDYALVLMDMQMPVMDGLTATREIRRRWPDRHLPIIALTANAMKGDLERCLEAGMDDFVSKPIDRDQLFGALRKWVPEDAQRTDQSDRSDPTDPSEEEIPMLDGIDIDDAMQRLGLPWKSIKKMLLRFADGQPKVLKELGEAMESNDWETARRHAHSIAGAGGNLSAVELRKRAKALEVAIKEEKGEYEELFAAVNEELTKVLTAIDRIRSAPSAEVSNKPVDIPTLRVALEDLKARLDEGDMGSIETAIGSFDQMGTPAQICDQISAIKSLVDGYNYFDAADKTEEALKLLAG